MLKILDLKGKKFGRLKVIKRVKSNKNGQSMWLCKCECKVEKVVQGNHLVRGHTKSCGCLQKDLARFNTSATGRIPDNRLSLGIANMRRAIAYYKRSAKERGLEYNLTEEQFKELTQQDCHYCGIKPSNIIKRKWTYGVYVYNGLDRVDNNKGYKIDNVVPCCKLCNGRKGKDTLQNYRNWIENSYNKMFGKEDIEE